MHILLVLSHALAASAAQHHMFVGTYGTSSIYGVTYDDVSRSLTHIRNNTTRPENEWLALSYDAKTLYSSGITGWSSFPVTSPQTIGPESSTTPNVGQCASLQGVYILASRRAPFSVYGSLACASTLPATPGSQGPYNEAALIYGMAMDPGNKYMYSSDWRSGRIWTHKVNADGSLTVVNSTAGPSAVSAPRTIVVHPSGQALYVVLEAWNAVALYSIDPISHFPIYTGGTFPLLPASKSFSMILLNCNIHTHSPRHQRWNLRRRLGRHKHKRQHPLGVSTQSHTRVSRVHHGLQAARGWMDRQHAVPGADADGRRAE